MGPLEISGTSSTRAQGKTPSCAADSRGAGERTGPAVPAAGGGAAASPPRSRPHERWRGTTPAKTHGKQPTAKGGGVRNLGKYLPRGKLPDRRAVLSRRAMGTLRRRLVRGAELGQAPCSLRTACSLLQHFSWLANHPQHLSRGCQVSSARCQHAEGQGHTFPSSSPCCTSRLLLSAPASPALAASHAALGTESYQWQARQRLVPVQEWRSFSRHLFCYSFHCISATSVDVRRFLTAPALLLR